MRIQTRVNWNSRSGFTFVETMVAMLTGAVMLAALYASFAFGYGAVKLAREDLRATQILLQQMETLRLTSFAAIQTGTSTNYFDPTGMTNGCGGAVYTITVTTNAPTSSDMPVQPVYYTSKIRKATATTTWPKSDQLPSRSLKTFARRSPIPSSVY